jgi:hypothetical protein
MALINQNRITADFVLSKIDEAQIFAYYYSGFSLKKSFSSPFRRDRNPSCSFRFTKAGKIVFVDYGRNECLDCFAFVAKLNNENYGKAVHRIACDFGLVNDCGSFGTKTSKTLIKKAELISEHVKKDTDIQITIGKWDREYLRMWDNLSITQEELEREEVYPVDKLYINGKFISNWRNELRYAYILNTGKQVYKKIYTPFAAEKRFKWISNIPLHIPFGLTRLPFESNRLIITKSQKERLLFLKFFPDVIALQAENPSALKDKTIKYIDKHYDDVCLFLDSDEAGYRNTEHFVQYNYRPYFIPSALQEEGLKDWAEMVEAYGIEAMELQLKQLNLI